MRISCSGIRLAGIIKLLPFQGVWAKLAKVQLLANNDVNFIQIFGVIKILQYICIQKNLNVNQMVKHLLN